MTRSLQGLGEAGLAETAEIAPLLVSCGRSKHLQGFLFGDCGLQDPLSGFRMLRPKARGVRASFEFVDGLGLGAEDDGLGLPEPPESLMRTATLAAKWISRLGGESAALSRWAADVDEVEGDGANSLLPSTQPARRVSRAAGTSTHFGSEGDGYNPDKLTHAASEHERAVDDASKPPKHHGTEVDDAGYDPTKLATGHEEHEAKGSEGEAAAPPSGEAGEHQEATPAKEGEHEADHPGKEAEHEAKEGESGEHEGKEAEHESKEAEAKESEHEGKDVKEGEKSDMEKKDEALKDVVVDPESGHVLDGKSGQEIDPETGEILDDGAYIDEGTGLAVDPYKGKIYDPVTGKGND